ncbi:MAG: dipeptidase [Bryobacterales bacterium]|nr:dipeptidase [Bryobacterales bacterium]
MVIVPMRSLVLVLLLAGIASAQDARTVSDAEVMKVHRSAILIDTHNDVTSATVAGLDIGKRRTEGHTDVPRLKEGGVGATFFAVFVSGSYVEGNRSANRTIEMIDTVRHDIIGRYPNEFEFAVTADQIVSAHKRGKIAALMGIEGGHAIEDSLRLLRSFYALGVRYMTLTHSNSNNWAGSSGEVGSGGLTAFGKEVVLEMNRLGMMVDISHVSDKTFWDALETSKAPIFASHSSCRAISPIPRNMSDEMIQALAKKGGLVQVNFGCEFVNAESAKSSPMLNPAMREKMGKMMAEMKGKSQEERRAAMRKMFAESGPRVRAKLSDVVAHIDRIVKIAGVDAVGIGSDYDGVGCVPEGLDDVSKFPNLTRALLERGYPAEDIRKIYGGNLLRVMRAAERTAAQLQRGS